MREQTEQGLHGTAPAWAIALGLLPMILSRMAMALVLMLPGGTGFSILLRAAGLLLALGYGLVIMLERLYPDEEAA